MTISHGTLVRHGRVVENHTTNLHTRPVQTLDQSLASGAWATGFSYWPLTFKFPKRSFGQERALLCSSLPSWFAQLHVLHHDEAIQRCVLPYLFNGIQVKKVRINSADPAFIYRILFFWRKYEILTENCCYTISFQH